MSFEEDSNTCSHESLEDSEFPPHEFLGSSKTLNVVSFLDTLNSYSFEHLDTP